MNIPIYMPDNSPHPSTVELCRVGEKGLGVLGRQTYPSRAAAARALPVGKTLRIERDAGTCVYKVYLPDGGR